MKRMFKVLFLSVIMPAVSGCFNSESPSVKTLYNDNLAQRDIKKEKYEEALTRYYSLLVEDVDRAETHSNIGVLLNKTQRTDDSLKSLLYALKLAQASGDQVMIFKIRYNLGTYYGALKKIPEALDNYQAALDLVPSSIETKTNIELLMRQQQEQQQGNQGEQKEDQKSGDNKDNKDKNENQGDKDKKDENKENQNDKDKKDDQKKESSPKYKPRPFKGDQLSEGDVKKILGELKNQEQKIRANFDKKEKKGKSKSNEKDW